MYPSTYSFPIGSKPADIIKAAVEQFKKIWKPEWNAQAQAIGRSPYEIVTIASLIETESKFDAERPKIASVINNRLAKNVPLGIDQTAIYIAKMQNRGTGPSTKAISRPIRRITPAATAACRRARSPPSPRARSPPLLTRQRAIISTTSGMSTSTTDHIGFIARRPSLKRVKPRYQQWLEQQREEKRTKTQTCSSRLHDQTSRPRSRRNDAEFQRKDRRQREEGDPRGRGTGVLVTIATGRRFRDALAGWAELNSMLR